MMFSSRTLAERNNDKDPWVHTRSGARFDSSSPGPDGIGGVQPRRLDSYTFAPRPEFQYGKLPANRILVAARHLKESGESWAVVESNLEYIVEEEQASVKQVYHAIEVLNRLVRWERHAACRHDAGVCDLGQGTHPGVCA